tara:strand:+ start:42 stop:170 length:129 start_codon:yes stop_codon:yes gene_type:complete
MHYKAPFFPHGKNGINTEMEQRHLYTVTLGLLILMILKAHMF